MNLIETIMRAKVESAVRPWAEMTGKPYRPSSGTEGMAFDAMWCAHCARDSKWRDDPDVDGGCDILSATFIYSTTDPEYPKDWVYGHDGRPCCTAFTTDPNKPLRCDKTADLFDPRP